MWLLFCLPGPSSLSNSRSAVFLRSSSPLTRHEASKYLLHLIGDLHTPLRFEGIGHGGNSINVYLAGVETNLHFIWDVSMLQKLTKSNENNEIAAAQKLAAKLFNSTDRTLGFEDQWEIMDTFGSNAPAFYQEKLDLLSLTWARQIASRYVRA